MSSDKDSGRSFDQNRKEAASVCAPQIRSLLGDWYEVPEEYIINVESVKDGEYDAGMNDIVDRLDYRGVDWLVPKDGELIPVGERLRKGERGEWRDMTLRTQNGTGNPSEGQTIPDAIEGHGIYPRDYVLAVREQWEVHRAVLLDTATVIERAQSPAVQTGYASNDDGSAYRWFRLADLLMQDCHQEVWCE